MCWSQPELRSNRCRLLFFLVAILVPLMFCPSLSGDQPETPSAQKASKHNRKFNERRYSQRLLKGDLKTRMAAIHTIRNSFLHSEAATNLLVKTCDRLMEEGVPDSSMLLIVDTLRYSAPTPQAGEALVRWFDVAIQNFSNNPETWRLVGLSALVSMRQFDHPLVLNRATELLQSEDYRIQMLAADIVGRQRYVPALDVLIELIKSKPYDEHYGFRQAILGALSFFPEKKAMDVLKKQASKLGGQLGFLIDQRLVQRNKVMVKPIDRLKRVEPGRMLKVVKSSTNLDDSTKPLARSHTYEFDVPIKDTDTEYPIKAPAYFYGHPIYANDVTFVIDISSSMNTRAGSNTRLERAKSEAIKAINNLPSTASFRIILFSDDVIDMMGSLVPANQVNKARYTQQIRQLRSQRMTNLYGGLKSALMDTAEPEVIFLVSDGEPTAGEIINPRQILIAARHLNMFRRVTINTISIGRRSTLLETLSADHAGNCRKVR